MACQLIDTEVSVDVFIGHKHRDDATGHAIEQTLADDTKCQLLSLVRRDR